MGIEIWLAFGAGALWLLRRRASRAWLPAIRRFRPEATEDQAAAWVATFSLTVLITSGVVTFFNVTGCTASPL